MRLVELSCPLLGCYGLQWILKTVGFVDLGWGAVCPYHPIEGAVDGVVLVQWLQGDSLLRCMCAWIRLTSFYCAKMPAKYPPPSLCCVWFGKTNSPASLPAVMRNCVWEVYNCSHPLKINITRQSQILELVKDQIIAKCLKTGESPRFAYSGSDGLITILCICWQTNRC